MRVLLLNNQNYPDSFYKHDIDEKDKFSKQDRLEKLITFRLNEYNYKLNIKKVIYGDISDVFKKTKVFVSKYVGFLLEIDEKLLDEITDKNNFIEVQEDFLEEKLDIIGYVFLSINFEQSRNILFTQSIFPELIDYTELYLDSPSYRPINKPVYVINMIKKEITAKSLIRRMVLMRMSGINFINIFNKELDKFKVPETFIEFIKLYETGNRLSSENIFQTEYYTVDLINKKFKLEIEGLLKTFIYNEDRGYNDFKGSSEKFYWMEIMPITIFAFKLEYDIDISLLKTFFEKYDKTFSENSKKFYRCKVLYKYFQKLSMREDYYV